MLEQTLPDLRGVARILRLEDVAGREDTDRAPGPVEDRHRGHADDREEIDRLGNRRIGADRLQVGLHELGDFHGSSSSEP